MTDLDFDVALEDGAVRPGSHPAQLASADAEAARALAGAALRRLAIGPADGEDDAAWSALGLTDQAEESLELLGGDFDVPAITAAEMLEDDAYGADAWVPTAPQAVVAPPNRTWMWGVVATLLLGVGAFAVISALPDDDAGERILAATSTPSAAASAAPASSAAPATVAAASVASAGAAPASAAPSSGPAAGGAPESAAPKVAAATPKPTRSARRPARRRPAAADKPATAKPAAAKPNPAPSARPARKATAEVDDLLGGLNGSRKSASKRPAAAVLDDPSLPKKLSKAQILKVVRANASKVSTCKRDGASGTVKVVMVIARTGRVTSATPGGSFAGTPAGVCVAAKVRAFRFPQFSGDAMRINMPFRL